MCNCNRCIFSSFDQKDKEIEEKEESIMIYEGFILERNQDLAEV